jgi:hypothetical protein
MRIYFSRYAFYVLGLIIYISPTPTFPHHTAAPRALLWRGDAEGKGRPKLDITILKEESHREI